MRRGGSAGVVATSAALLSFSVWHGTSIAAYVLSPFANGQSSVVAAPGSTFQVDLVLATISNERHDAAQFRVELSEPGLVLMGYTWSSPYSTLFDQSRPSGSQLPIAITNDLLKGDGFPDATADVEFSNLTDSGDFGAGTLMSLQLMVPANWKGSDQISLRVVPDLFTRGFDEVQVFSFAELAITIPSVPGVASLSLLGSWMSFRRRRAY